MPRADAVVDRDVFVAEYAITGYPTIMLTVKRKDREAILRSVVDERGVWRLTPYFQQIRGSCSPLNMSS